MHGTFTRRIATAALAAAAFTAFGAAAAPAYADIVTDGTGSTGGGNQLQLPVSAPINLCGNSPAVLGASGAVCHGQATVNNDTGDDSATTSGTGSVLGGNQAQAPVSAPINACGNGVSGGGKAAADCPPGSDATVNQP